LVTVPVREGDDRVEVGYLVPVLDVDREAIDQLAGGRHGAQGYGCAARLPTRGGATGRRGPSAPAPRRTARGARGRSGGPLAGRFRGARRGSAPRRSSRRAGRQSGPPRPRRRASAP